MEKWIPVREFNDRSYAYDQDVWLKGLTPLHDLRRLFWGRRLAGAIGIGPSKRCEPHPHVGSVPESASGRFGIGGIGSGNDHIHGDSLVLRPELQPSSAGKHENERAQEFERPH